MPARSRRRGKTGNYGYLPNFLAYVACHHAKTGDDGQTYYFLVNYGWMNGEDLQPLTPSRFTGMLLTREVTFRFGWVLADTQSVNAAGTPIQTYRRYQVVHEVATDSEKPGYIAIGADEWLPEESAGPGQPGSPGRCGAEHLPLYLRQSGHPRHCPSMTSCKLVFATLISSGKNSWTFEGRFAIV